MSDDAFQGILRAARVGADWAWRELYTDLAPRLAAYARACRVADPEDVVGEVFLRAVRALDRFEGDRRAFRTWVFTLARNLVVDEQRKLVRRRTAPLPTEVLAELGPRGDAEQEALRALAEERVREAIAPLTRDQRHVLFLRIIGGLTIDEIATVLGKRPGAVKALQARAVRTLERRLSSGAVTL
jgi:RNA polymerase sigma-70 factor (ECF subfamily)